jgi:hypothetical protein
MPPDYRRLVVWQKAIESTVLIAKNLSLCELRALDEAQTLCDSVSRMLNALNETIATSE